KERYDTKMNLSPEVIISFFTNPKEPPHHLISWKDKEFTTPARGLKRIAAGSPLDVLVGAIGDSAEMFDCLWAIEAQIKSEIDTVVHGREDNQGDYRFNGLLRRTLIDVAQAVELELAHLAGKKFWGYDYPYELPDHRKDTVDELKD